MTEEEDDIDGLAAEYVLGSLSPAERGEVDRRRRTDAALAAAVDAWERRLAPLSDRVPPVAPPPHLLDGILNRLPAPGARDARDTRTAQVIPLRPPPRRAKALAIGAGALAACLAVIAAWFFHAHRDGPKAFVAELHRLAGGTTADEGTRPSFLVNVDVAARIVTARAVTARPRPGQSYQLWLLPEPAPGAGAARSLGIIQPTAATMLPWPANATATDLANARLGVSLEPEGGSPTGTPSGPMLFEGKLVPSPG